MTGRRLREWLLRRPVATEPLSVRSWLLDIGLAAGLAVIALLSHDQADGTDVGPLVGPGRVPVPPVFPDPRSELAGQTSPPAGPPLLENANSRLGSMWEAP